MKKQLIIENLENIQELLRLGLFGTEDEYENTGKYLMISYDRLTKLICELKKRS